MLFNRGNSSGNHWGNPGREGEPLHFPGPQFPQDRVCSHHSIPKATPTGFHTSGQTPPRCLPPPRGCVLLPGIQGLKKTLMN